MFGFDYSDPREGTTVLVASRIVREIQNSACTTGLSVVAVRRSLDDVVITLRHEQPRTRGCAFSDLLDDFAKLARRAAHERKLAYRARRQDEAERNRAPVFPPRVPPKLRPFVRRSCGSTWRVRSPHA